MASFSVRVVDEDQEPIEGATVVLGFTSLIRGMTHSEYSDSDGYAYFNNFDEGEVEVFIRGSNYGSYYYENDGSITITI